MPAEDAPYFEQFEIKTTLKLATHDGQEFERKDELTVSRASFPEQVQTAIGTTPGPSRKPFCLVTLGAEANETFASREHLVPEGLGFPWAALPAGVGTCDRINKALGEAELSWLRFGPMGAFRPFYVSSGKDGPPEYHAPMKSQRRLSFVRSSAGGRQLEVFSDDELGLPHERGKSVITIRTAASDANSTHVSLALHKLAYLAFWLIRPDAVLDAVFDSTRAFLAAASKPNFRPMLERMIPGSAPGLALHFMVGMREVPSAQTGASRAFAIESVHAAVHAHHMFYCLALAGDLQLEAVDDSWTVRRWEAPEAPPRQRVVEFAYSAEGVRFRS